MVRWVCLGCLLAIFAGSTSASADWSSAGGALFVGGERSVSAARPPPPSGLSQPFSDMIEKAALHQGLDPKLLHALVLVESAYRPTAISPAGALGLAQLMPLTAQELGVGDPLDPAQNLLGGATYLSAQIRRFGDLRLALAAYNAGPARVAALGAVPDIPETRSYVDLVIECFLALSAGRVITSAKGCPSQEVLP
jgi:soluble lytic murein transglycosylase-like protein